MSVLLFRRFAVDLKRSVQRRRSKSSRRAGSSSGIPVTMSYTTLLFEMPEFLALSEEQKIRQLLRTLRTADLMTAEYWGETAELRAEARALRAEARAAKAEARALRAESHAEAAAARAEAAEARAEAAEARAEMQAVRDNVAALEEAAARAVELIMEQVSQGGQLETANATAAVEE